MSLNKKNNIIKDVEVQRKLLYRGLIGYLFNWQHKVLSPDYLINEKKVLEIGPGYEPHCKYKKLYFEEYYCIDTNESKDMKIYFQNKFPYINFKSYKGDVLPFSDNTFDRVIISHALEHIKNPEEFIGEMMRVLKKGSTLSIALPCDNGLLWRLGRYFTILRNTIFFNKLKKKGGYQWMTITIL